MKKIILLLTMITSIQAFANCEFTLSQRNSMRSIKSVLQDLGCKYTGVDESPLFERASILPQQLAIVGSNVDPKEVNIDLVGKLNIRHVVIYRAHGFENGFQFFCVNGRLNPSAGGQRIGTELASVTAKDIEDSSVTAVQDSLLQIISYCKI